MEKLTALMAATAVAISSSAATVYFETGNGFGTDTKCWYWNPNPSGASFPGVTTNRTETKNGKTYLVWDTGTAADGIIFSNSSGTKAGGGDLQVVDNGIYNSSGYTNTLWVADYKPDVYLAGNFNNWGSTADYQFSTTDYITYTFSKASLPANAEFKVVADGAWLSSQTQVVLGQQYTLSTGGNNMTLKDSNATDLTFTYNFNTRVLTVTGTASGEPEQPDVVSYWIHGQITGNSNWESTKMTIQEDGIWSVTGNFVTGNFGIKQTTNADSNQTGWYGYSALDSSLADNCNAAAGGNIELTQAGNYTITFNPATSKITVRYNGAQNIDYSKWYVNILGTFNNWQDNGLQPGEGNTATKHLQLPIGTGQFKVKVYNGSSDMHYSTGGPIPQNEWVVITGNNDKNMTVSGATEGQTFDVEWDCSTNSLKVSSEATSVQSITTPEGGAIYFNLQGQRVENPEKGIFIRVANGSAVKIIR